MPTAALRTCSSPGCPELTRFGRCNDHRGQAEVARGTRSQRGYTNRWLAFARSYLLRHPVCVHCGGIAAEVDHIDGKGPNGPRGYDRVNLRPLCGPCHARRTAADQPGGWNARA